MSTELCPICCGMERFASAEAQRRDAFDNLMQELLATERDAAIKRAEAAEQAALVNANKLRLMTKIFKEKLQRKT